IYANESINTTIDGVEVPTFADVKLRLVVGRDHNTSLTPIVTFNGHLLNHQLETMGDEQTGRDRFFGLLEFNVPFDVLNNSNTIEVIFPDNGGHLASVNMKVLSISDSARPSSGDVEGVLLSSNTDTLAIGQQTNITASVYPYYATNKKVVFSSSDDNIASVDNNGLITGHSAGQVVITATSEQGEFNDSVTINVEAPTNISMQFDDRNTYINTVYTSGETLDVTVNFDAGTGNSVAADFGGIEYFFRHMASNWSVIKDIKIRDASVIGKQRGTSSVAIPLNDVTPSADLENGEFYFLFIRFKNTAGQVKNVNAFPIQVAENIVVIEPSLTFDDASKYTNTTYETNGTLDVQVNFEAGTGQTVSDSLGGIKFFLRELTPNFNVVNDVIVYDSSAIGNQSGIASASIPLAGLTPSAQLPDGNFYYLFATFQSTSGTKQNIDGVFPINIEQSATLEVADINQLKSAIHIVGQKMNVAVDFNMGSGNTVTDGVGGVRYILRELTPTFSVVKDIIVEDSSVIGLNSGTSNIAIPLDGITPASELPTGHFYYLFVVIESSDNSRLTTAVFPLQIEAQPGDFDRDGDVDQRDFVELTKAIAKKQIISAAFDFDNNGVVDQKDAVKMRSLCSNKNCAVE
ncbi:MAG: Ig-like domain-containing protein, partial [Gammaproteobacteria bacterium]|nr:Ig-like domain-containing protein [Gammaproteobacteria bacterium]